MAESQSKSNPAISDVQQYPLLATKLYIPQSLPTIVPRPDLTKRLTDGMGAALTLVSAPAGFGKTTLLGEWIHKSEIPVAWLSLDAGDNDPVRFLTYLVAAVQKIEPGIGKDALATLQSPQSPPIEIVLTSLINEITAIPDDFVLALDDYHLVDTEQIHNIVEFLLDHLPRQIHLVMACRADPPLPLARLRSRNQMSEFRASDLSFTTEETTEFFNKVMSLGLSNEDIAMLESRTEGWIAGMQLAGLSMKSCEDVPSFIKTFTGDDRHIVDYLAEQVLDLQSEQIRNFLLHTSILDRLSEPLCDFVTGQTGSQEILNQLDRANLFIVPLDNKRHWYRYHHLFANLLQQQLRQTQGDLVFELHNRASKWYEDQAMVEPAIEHALVAKDFERAAYLIEKIADVTWEHGEHVKLMRWLDKLSEEQLSNRPQIDIFRCWIQHATGQQKAAEKSLQVVEQALESIGEKVSPDDSDQQVLQNAARLKSRASVMHAMLAFRKGDIPNLAKFSRQALDLLPEEDLAWRGIAAMALGDSYGISGNMNAANQAYTEAIEISKAAGNFFVILYTSVKLGIILEHQGKLHQAQEIYRELMTLVDIVGWSQSVITGSLHALWSEVLCHWNDIDSAYQFICRGVELSKHENDVANLVWTHLIFIKILLAMGDLTRAKETILKLEIISRESHVPPWIINRIAAWKARIWLAEGDLDAAHHWVHERMLNVTNELQFAREPENIVFARILVARGELDDAVNLLDRLIQEAEAGDRITRLIEMLLIKSLALKTQGDTNQPLASLEKALSLARPGGYIRIFIDEGPPMAELLEQMLDTDMDFPRPYVKKLLTACKVSSVSKPDGGLVSPLSDRELEVLRLMAAGLSNKEITQQLFISMNTVKTHVRNTIGKLGVDNRTKAVAKAKEVGLL